MKSIREILASPLAVSVMEIFKSPSKKRIEAAGSATTERENTYVTIKVPKIEPDPVEFFVPKFHPDFYLDQDSAAAEVAPEYFRDPIVPAGFLQQLIRETAEKRRADRRDFYRRKKSQAKNWRKWRR